jgi:hypothetical protein
VIVEVQLFDLTSHEEAVLVNGSDDAEVALGETLT